MSNQHKEKKDLQDFAIPVFVWICKEDKKRADEFLLKQKLEQENEKEDQKNRKKGEKQKSVFVCAYCQKGFPAQSPLNLHIKIHTGQKNYHCNLCSYSSSRASRLQDQIRRHLNEKRFKCPEGNCKGAFVTSTELKNHQLVHNKNEKPFSCSACPFKTHAKSCLTSHMKNIHSKSKRFACPRENCEYSAKRKSHLIRHSKIHSEEKNQVCPHPDCEFRKKWPGYLKVHLEIHLNGEKIFKCHFCAYSCRSHCHLVRHIRRHTGETPFACQLCLYKSKNNCNLKIHMKTH